MLDRYKYLKGEAWWTKVIQNVHDINQEVKREEPRWNKGILAMETALSESKWGKLSRAGEEILTEAGHEVPEAGEAYGKLVKLLETERRRKQRQELVDMTKKELQKEWQQEPVTNTKRRSKVNSLLRQLVERKQMVAVRDKNGNLCSGTEAVGQALGEFWQGIMVSPPEGPEECRKYLETCDPPGYWKTTLPQLWKEPDIDTVMNALDSLDGTSAPGMDGIPAILYQVYAAHFAPRMLQAIHRIHQTGEFPEEWSVGIMRCIPKEAGNLKVDKQRPITLLNTRCKWVTMTLKIGMQDYLKTVIPPNQKGFVQGRNMHEHLLSVQEIQREG